MRDVHSGAVCFETRGTHVSKGSQTYQSAEVCIATRQVENILIGGGGEFKLCDFGSATTQVLHPGQPGQDRGVCYLLCLAQAQSGDYCSQIIYRNLIAALGQANMGDDSEVKKEYSTDSDIPVASTFGVHRALLGISAGD
jgi:hypothetical protein